jgi:hypothetical protein
LYADSVTFEILESSKNIIQFILIAILAYGISFTSSAGDLRDSTVVQKFRIYYPINDTELHEDYLDNPSALKSIKKQFVTSPRIDSIIIYSYASPEGPFKLNTRLARERGERARRYLLETMASVRDFPDSLIIIKPTAENWEGLLDMVNSHYPYADKQDVINLLTREDISNDRKKVLLKKLNGGRPWRYIRSNILPNLRYATWVAEWVHVPLIPQNIPAIEAIRSKAVAQANTISTPPIAPQHYPVLPPQEGRKTILALKTNLLYDILSLTNFSIEVPFWKDNMSVLYYHQFPWWTWGQADNEFCTRFLSIGAEARWWFKTKDRLNGHFLGAYSESGKYDFEYQRRICYQGEFYSAGLSYGYAMPIGRNLNLEFSISAGYASIAYRGYTPSEDYEILWRDPNKVGRLHYFGPTKAQVSLVIPIRVKTKGGNAR